VVSGVFEPVAERVLITGATGFLGQHLVRRVVGAGARVYAGVAPDEPPERVAALPVQVHRLTFDMRVAGAVRAAVAEAAPQVIFHLAAVGATDPGVDPHLALAVNAGGALHLLEAVRKCVQEGDGVQRVVLVGTCYEYGPSSEYRPAFRCAASSECRSESEFGPRETVEGLDPFNAYAASKVAAWAFGRMYWRAHGLPVVTVRPFQVYGPGQPDHTLIPAAIRAALAGVDFPMTPGGQERDFIYVDDVIDGFLAIAAAPGIDGCSLDLGTGQVHTLRRVVECIWTITRAQGRVLPGALPYRPGDVMHLAADADRTARLTGWRAGVGLDQGLRRTIEIKGAMPHD
jgi:nucleoside-diphosphate-sugar epimerase